MPKGYVELHHMYVGPLEILLKQKILNVQSRRKKITLATLRKANLSKGRQEKTVLVIYNQGI